MGDTVDRISVTRFAITIKTVIKWFLSLSFLKSRDFEIEIRYAR